MSNQHPWYCAFAACACVLWVLCTGASAAQSNNLGISVLPAPGKVAVDGDVKDWDWSGRIWVFADKSIRNRYSVEAAAMWDKDNLYLAAKWKDPTPMYNMVDPQFNPNDGWKSDSWQLRIQTDRPVWLTTNYFTPKKMPVLHVEYGKDKNTPGGGKVMLLFKENSIAVGEGVEMAYKMDEDGKGYVQEMKIPWGMLYEKSPQIQPGMIFRMGMEFLWGDPSGKTWPVHRYADNVQPGETGREFFWKNIKGWGNAELLAAGNIAMRQYMDTSELLAGTVPVRVTIPKKAARFTIAINDAQGDRVRNLAGDFTPEDYLVSDDGDQRTVEVKWDCLDDKGKAVAPGAYQVLGLSHDGLGAEYDMCYYNPGTPPWESKSGGAWGADHMPPLNVARAGDWMIVSWAFAEGGHGLIGIGPDGLKKWGEKRGATALAADEKYVYAVASSWHASGVLCRFGKSDGSYQPFTQDGKARPFELLIKDVLGDQAPAADGQPGEAAQVITGGQVKANAQVVSLAAQAGKLAMATGNGKLAVLDSESAAPLKIMDVVKPGSVTFGADGRLYAILDGQLNRVHWEAGKLEPIPTPELGKAGAIAVDNDGNIAIADRGADSQVKVYSPAGKLMYTAGKKGGRPWSGAFDEQAMMAVSSIASDSQGRIWAIENWDDPRRVSVWGKDGKLVRDYIGNTAYAGTGSYLVEQDASVAYIGSLEVKLDRQARTWKVSQILWAPDASKAQAFPLWTRPHWFSNPNFVTSSAGGKEHRYLYFNGIYSTYHAIYMQRGTAWQPVAALTSVGDLQTMLPQLDLKGHNAKEDVIWNDTNGDGAVSLDECAFVPEGAVTKGNWGTRLGSDLTLYLDGITRYRPIKFAADGAPIYGAEGIAKLSIAEVGDYVPLAEDNLLLCLSTKRYPMETSGILGIDLRDQTVLWSYPDLYPGVHGSHRAPMARPGLVIGPLKICGAAKISDQVGTVFLMRGNLGQDFLMTTDGLFVGSMFQDGRLPNESLPDAEDKLKGMPLDGLSHGSEPFNGWFGKQADGKVRMTTGFPRQAVMIVEVKGLESIRKFKGTSIQLDAPTIAKAEQDNAARAVKAGEEKIYAIRKLASPPSINGGPDGWPENYPAITIKREGAVGQGKAMLGYDAKNLYVLFEVQDATPMLNEGKDYTRLFKTGDAVDVQLCTDSSAPAKRTGKLLAGDVRLVFSKLNGKAAVVLTKPVDASAPPDKKVVYHSPVGDKILDRVEPMSDATVVIKTASGRYWVEAAVPLKSIGLEPQAGKTIRGDVGFISSDAHGLINTARTYWSNQETNLVSDLPSEAWLYPDRWGQFKFEE